MSAKTIPYFQFPATVCFIDDDELFAETAKTYMDNKTKINVFYKSPQEVLNLLATKKTLFDHIAAFNQEIDLEEVDDEGLNISKINYQAIINQIYDSERFNEIAAFVVDYSMPKMTGFEFFKKIKHLPQKKIILTGHDDTAMAVEAFNAGLIDKFLVKSFQELKHRLNSTVDTFVDAYFNEFSRQTFPANKFCESPNYINIFATWLTENVVIEYYRCNENGSFLGFDKKGSIVWLVFIPESQIATQLEMATIANASSEVIDQLKKKKTILFLFSDVENKLNTDEWGKYFFPVQGNTILNDEKVYYATIKDESFSLQKHKLKPFGIIAS